MGGVLISGNPHAGIVFIFGQNKNTTVNDKFPDLLVAKRTTNSRDSNELHISPKSTGVDCANMDLFHMKRYWSDGEEQEENEDQPGLNSEADILNRLKNKVQKEEKQPGQPDKGQSKDESLGAPSKKKRKKKKAAGDGEEGGGTGFTVLGEDLAKGRNKVRRVLPHWLANPDIVSVDLSDQQVAVTDLGGLDDAILKNLSSNGVTHFFPVQRQLIPYMLANQSHSMFRPHDVCVSAPTGSGKTLAFVLPIVQTLRNRIVPKVRALVVLPVQDLATQVYKVFLQYTEGTQLRVKLVSGQKGFKQEQSELVKPDTCGGHHSMVDILVATPGRIVDHIQKTQGFSLEHLRFLVVDEADRVMEDIQNDWLNQVEGAVYSSGKRPRPGPLTVANALKKLVPLQKLLFSATLSQNPEKLEQMNLFEPRLFTSVVQPKDICAAAAATTNPAEQATAMGEFAGKYTTPAELKEVVVKVTGNSLNKPALLDHLIKSHKMKKALLFTKSSENAHTLAVLLKQYGYSAKELYSKVPGKRAQILNQFKRGAVDFLVATDALARGIDIGEIDHVVSYDCPTFVKTYIHRVGRTARAGRPGTGLTIVEKAEAKRFSQLLKEACKIDRMIEETVDEEQLDLKAYQEAREAAAAVIKNERQSKKRPSSAGAQRHNKKKGKKE